MKSVDEVKKALLACGMKFDDVFQRSAVEDGGIVRISLERDTEYGYDKLSELTKLLGTTDLRFVWDRAPPYSEWTGPGSGDHVLIDVSWPANADGC